MDSLLAFQWAVQLDLVVYAISKKLQFEYNTSEAWGFLLRCAGERFASYKREKNESVLQ